MTLRECPVPGCPNLTRRGTCIEHQNEADAQAFVAYASRRYGVNLSAVVADSTCPRCGLVVDDKAHVPGSSPRSCRFSRAGG